MPNKQYTGTLIGNDGEKLKDVRVVLTSGIVSGEYTTGENGNFIIIVNGDAMDPNNTTLTFSKGGYSLFTVKNPQPTGDFDIEDSKIKVNFGGVLDLEGGFGAGKYLITSLDPFIQEKLNWELYNIQKFIEKYPDNYKITIIASESKVTNYDREEFTEDGKPNEKWSGPRGTYNNPLGQKELSKRRYDALKKYIEDFFKRNNISTNINPTVRPPELLVGGPDYTAPTRDPKTNAIISGDNPDDKKYTPYQFVKIKVGFSIPPCKDIEFQNRGTGGGRGTSLPIDKVAGSNKLTLDALAFPDLFSIPSIQKQLKYFIQNPSTQGDIKSWRYIIYLSTFEKSSSASYPRSNGGAFSNLIDPPEVIKKSDLKPILIRDLTTASNAEATLTESPTDEYGIKNIIDIKNQLIIFIKKYITFAALTERGLDRFGYGEELAPGVVRNQEEAIKNWKDTLKAKSPEELVDIVFFMTKYANETEGAGNAFLYPLKRENTVIDISTVPDNTTFTLDQINGAITNNSFYKVNICNR